MMYGILNGQESLVGRMTISGRGEPGVGIETIVQTETSTASGGRNTWTVTLTDGRTSSFYVRNGAKGDTGVSITNVALKSSSGLVDTYEITFSDGNTTTFNVTNGNGISSIAKTGTSGNVDTYTINYTNGTTSTFTVTNSNVSSVNGQTGDVVLTANEITYDGTAAQTSGSIGKEITDLKTAISKISGITPAIRDALLTMFRYAVYKDGYTSALYDHLYSALYGERTLQSISATFNQGENIVANTDSLDSIKQYLVVTALYSDGTTETVEGYTLSGTLNTAESEITAAYSGQTDTFSVNVSILPSGYTHYNCVVANGTQYMDSGLSEIDMQDCGIKLKEAVTQLAESSGHVFSSRNFYTPFLWVNSSLSSRNVNATRFGNQIPQPQNYERWALNEQHELTAYMNGGNGISLDGEEIYTLEKGSSTPSTSNHFYFFAYGGNPTNTRYPLRGKLYYWKIYSQAGTLIHEYVPCTNGAEVAGLYDTIGGAFYSSETSTALSVE